MPKMSGLGSNFYVGAFDLSNDLSQINTIRAGQAVLPSTGIDKLAMERMPAHKDGELGFTTYLNDAVGAAHPVLSALPRTDVVMTAVMGVPAIGSHAACQVGKQVGYNPTRADDGSIRFEVSALANAFGLEWGQLLTPGKRTDTVATNGSSYDYGAAVGTTAFGLQLYWHLFAFTGTSVTLTVQSSTDNAAGDPFATVTGATSGALSAVGAGRVATANNVSVERYLRLVTTGTFSNAQFAVAVVRNPELTAF